MLSRDVGLGGAPKNCWFGASKLSETCGPEIKGIGRDISICMYPKSIWERIHKSARRDGGGGVEYEEKH